MIIMENDNRIGIVKNKKKSSQMSLKYIAYVVFETERARHHLILSGNAQNIFIYESNIQIISANY